MIILDILESALQHEIASFYFFWLPVLFAVCVSSSTTKSANKIVVTINKNEYNLIVIIVFCMLNIEVKHGQLQDIVTNFEGLYQSNKKLHKVFTTNVSNTNVKDH